MNLKIPPLALLILVGLFMMLSSSLLPALDFVFPPKLVMGVAAIFLGVVVARLGVYEFRKAKTTVDPRNPQKSESLVGSGIYKISRNPMYVGFFLMLFGWCLFLANYVALLFLPLFVLYINAFQIKPEESFLSQKFGSAYTDYCRRVRRWV